MRGIALAVVLGVMAMGCKGLVHIGIGSGVVGSGKSGSVTMTVGSGKTLAEFNKIETNGAFDVVVKNGPRGDVVITGDDNIVGLVKCTVSGKTLVVKTDENYSSKLPLKVSVTLPDMEGVILNGSGDANVDGLAAKDAEFQIYGSGDIVVTGTTDSLSASIDGSGDIDVSNLKAKKAKASINGSGTIKVYASDSLNANVSGSGDILYKGSPKDVGRSINGSGDIKPLN